MTDVENLKNEVFLLRLLVESLVKSKDDVTDTQSKSITALEKIVQNQSMSIISLNKMVEEMQVKLNTSTISKKNEAYYQAILVKKGFGDHVRLNLGITDLTGPNHHIEVKNWKDWIKAYKAVYFFGYPPKSKKLKDVTDFLKSKRVKMFSFHSVDDSIIDHWIDGTEDHLRTFFQETIEKSENNDDFVQITDIKRRYNSWYEKKGLNLKLKDMDNFIEFLERPEIMGPKPKKTTISKKDSKGHVLRTFAGSREHYNVNGWKGWKFVIKKDARND